MEAASVLAEPLCDHLARGRADNLTLALAHVAFCTRAAER